MKTYLVIILFLIVGNEIFAQKEEKIRPGKPVNSGFVFIDGKYIEPPYKFKQKGPCRIYLNGHYIHNCLSLTDTVANPYKVDKLPEIPETIDSMTSFNELKSLKYNNQSYLGVISNYFYTHYPHKEAGKRLCEHMLKHPNIKAINHGLFIFRNGDSVYMDPAPFDYNFFEKYGIHSNRQVPSPIELYKKGDKKIISMIEILIKNGGLVFDSNNKLTYNFFPEYTRHKTFTDYFKIDTLSMPREVLDTIKINMKYLERLKRENMLQNNNTLKNTNRMKSSVAYSPATNVLKVIFPSTWDINAFGNYQMEINNLNNYIAGNGYEYAQQIDFIYDATANDDMCGNLTYNAVKNIANVAGILLVGTHGRPPNDPDTTHLIDNGFFIWYATSKDAIELWCNNDPLVHPTYIYHPSNIGYWSQGIDLWGAFVQSDWVNTYWKNSLEQNRAITILSSCYSYTNGMVEACKGGIAFGYNNLSYEYNSIENEKQLFKRMNGTIDGGQYREASDAYIHMPVHLDAFMYRANCLITLCLTLKSRYPEAGATVGLQGDGWFEVDTYCDATVPINDVDFNHSPIAFEWTNPGLSITNVRWDDPDGDGLSNKIVFHWESTSNNTVTVKINHSYWQSAPSMNGQYHLLDYNKVTPNNEDGQYIFTISSSVPTQAPIADFSYTISGNTVYFQDQSANTPTSWQWNFGDGQSSTQANVSHTYTNGGLYNVTLTVSNLYGSSSKTKQVSISNIPQYVTVSGRVEDENFIPIAGATVSCSYGSTTTNSNGYYSLQVPYNASDCGAIIASAPGYQSASTCSCNNLISNKSCDFTLFAVNLYIYTQGNVHSAGVGFPVTFYVSKTNGNQYYWEVLDSNYNTIYSQNIWAWAFSYTFDNAGIYYIRVIVDDLISPEYNIEVLNLTCSCAGFSIGSSCHVIKTNSPVTFWNIGNVPDDIKNNTCINTNYAGHSSCYAPTGRRWITAYGSPYEYRTNIYSWGGTNPPDPWYYTTSFSHGGKYSIKYEIVTERNVYGEIFNPHIECWSAMSIYSYADCEHYGEIIVVDCNAYSACNNNGCPNSIPGWDEWGRYHQWSGTFYLNQQANSYINNYNLILSACNDVILDDGFVADGTHEFVAETEDFNCHPNKDEHYNNYFKQNDSIQSKWDNNNYINIYPNPFYDEININSSLKPIQIIRLYNVLGILIIEEPYTSSGCKINTSLLNEGVYIIEIMIDNKPYRVKLIKQAKL